MCKSEYGTCQLGSRKVGNSSVLNDNGRDARIDAAQGCCSPILWLAVKVEIKGKALGSYREDIVALILFASHHQAQFLHTLGTLAGQRPLALRDLAPSGAVAVLLVELLPASHALLL